MASKKKQELTYLQMPLPEGRKASKMTKRSWSGLSYRQTLDTGTLSMESNISTQEAPYLTPSQKTVALLERKYEKPISIFGFDDIILVVYRQTSAILLDYITTDANGNVEYVYTGCLKDSNTTDADEAQRSIVQFNVYDTPTDPVTGQYVKRLLIFPDKKSMPLQIMRVDSVPTDADKREDVLYCQADTGEYFQCVYDTKNSSWNVSIKNSTSSGFILDDMDVLVREYTNATAETDESGEEIYPPPESASHNYYYRNTYNQEVYRYCEYETADGGSAYGWKVCIPPAMPGIKYATVYLSRVFGVDEDRVYASGYNDYTNWNLDTVNEYNESNAWCSPAQSNTKAGGAFTGITTFLNHVILFKKDFIHEIYNTKNPFRIQDVFAEGAIDNRTIQDVDGSLVFVSTDGVKVYTGSNPRDIGYHLNLDKITAAVSGTDGRNYYLYCEDENHVGRMFTYDTFVDQWSEQSPACAVVGFCRTINGMYMLGSDGILYRMDSGDYAHNWSFETDLFTNETVDIKHVKKIQMLADIASGSNVRVYMLYDDEIFDAKASHLVYSSSDSGKKAIRVKPRKTAHYGIKLHIEGFGYVKIYELELFIEAGGELYV